MDVLTTQALARLSPFSGMGDEMLKQLLALAHLENIPRSLRPMQFDWHHKIAYLLKGELKLDYTERLIKLLVGGHAETMVPLGREGRVPLGARAITDVCLLWFDENELDILMTWDQLVPSASKGSGEAADWRTMSGIFDARQLTLGAFASLPAAHIDGLLTSFKRQRVSAGEVIVRQGEPGDYYYVVERGRAIVTREIAGANMELAEIKAGDAFGEEALIAEMPRNATVTMRTDGELLRLDGADFVRLLREPLLQKLRAEDALSRIGAGAIWLDVRFPAEYRNDGLAGAINIPLNELRDALPTMDRNTEYVVYCQTGRRSSAAAFLLSQRGFHASLLEGGLRRLTAMEKTAA